MSTKGFNHNACILCNKSPYKYPGLSLHRFPTCESLRLKWLEACNLTEKDYRSSRKLCSSHFDINCYNTGHVRKSLRPGSIPSIFTQQDLGYATVEEEQEQEEQEEEQEQDVEYENIEPATAVEESPIEDEKPFCPPTMVRLNHTIPNTNCKVQWACRRCLTLMFSEDAVHKHLETRCNFTKLEGINDDDLEDDFEVNDEVNNEVNAEENNEVIIEVNAEINDEEDGDDDDDDDYNLEEDDDEDDDYNLEDEDEDDYDL